MHFVLRSISTYVLLLALSGVGQEKRPERALENAMPAKSRVDLSVVTLRANDHVEDSFSHAMLAAAKALGTAGDADYASVYCASANAFAPMLSTGEDCTSHWACEAWLADRAMEQVARVLGLQATRLELPEVNPTWEEARRQEAMRRTAAVIREAMDRGEVVLTTGGWDIGLKQVDGKWRMAGPHGFVFWGAAGIVTDADPGTGTIQGMHPNGHRDNPIVRQAGMWALAPAPGARPQSLPMARETLRLAVERIRGEGRFRRQDAAIYGTDAMRVWADHMGRTPGFCAECWDNGAGKSWTDALDNGLRLRRAAEIVARYLRSVPGMPAEASQELAAAAACYDRVAAALAPSVKQDSPDHYRHWIGKMDRQSAHAAVLRQANAELLQAANHIERVLWMTDSADVAVRREGNRVWIAGAKELFRKHFAEVERKLTTPWAERSDSYMYLAQLRIAGWNTDYADLITVAGYGPSFAYAPRLQDRWGAHYFPPKGRDERVAHAMGCQYRWRQYGDVEQYWQALKQAIDEGQAVHAPNEEDILFVGYVEADRPEDRKVMPVALVFVDADEWTWEQFVRWHARSMVGGWLGRVEKRVEPWSPRESAKEVLATMLAAGTGEDSRCREGDRVVWGVAGIEAYAKDLADMAKSGAEEDKGGFFQGGWRGCHNVYPQISGRPAAAVYLKRVAPLFDGEVRESLLEAAEAYGDATRAWGDYTGQLGRECKQAAGVEHGVAWTSAAQRQAGAAAVARAAERERAALDSLRAALGLLGEPLD